MNDILRISIKIRRIFVPLRCSHTGSIERYGIVKNLSSSLSWQAGYSRLRHDSSMSSSTTEMSDLSWNYFDQIPLKWILFSTAKDKNLRIQISSSLISLQEISRANLSYQENIASSSGMWCGWRMLFAGKKVTIFLSGSFFLSLSDWVRGLYRKISSRDFRYFLISIDLSPKDQNELKNSLQVISVRRISSPKKTSGIRDMPGSYLLQKNSNEQKISSSSYRHRIL